MQNLSSIKTLAMVNLSMTSRKKKKNNNKQNSYLIFFEYVLWGPIIHGSGPFALRESKGLSRGELRPKLYNAEHQTVLWCSRGQLSPRQIQNLTKRRRVNPV